MNSNTQYEYLTEVNASLHCSLCTKPYHDPVMIECLHVFCEQCIRHYSNEKQVCPLEICKKSFDIKKLTVAPINIKSMVDELAVKCTVCETDLTQGIFDKHINNDCPKVNVKCLATDIRCPWEGARDQLSEHLETCTFHQLQPVFDELMKKNQQQSSQIEMLLQHVEQQKKQLNEVQLENQKQIDTAKHQNQQQCELLEKQIQEFRSQYQNLQEEIKVLVDQRYAQLETNQKEEQSILRTKFQNCRKEVTTLIDQRHTELNDKISTIQKDSQCQHNLISVDERCKKLEIENERQSNQIQSANMEIIELKKQIANLKGNTECSTVLLSTPCNSIQTYNNKTIAGGHGSGPELNKLNNPLGIYVDNDQAVYIADYNNHRIIRWKLGATTGELIAGGNGNGSRSDQLNSPTDVIVDKRKNMVFICDSKNRRVMAWSLQDNTNGKMIINNIDCYGLAMDNQNLLYVSDTELHRVVCYSVEQKKEIFVVGDNGHGRGLNQFNEPRFVFVDEDRYIYVTDSGNHRVMKWKQGEKEGTIMAGGRDRGDSVTQLDNPQKLFVDSSGNVYIADLGNNRVMRWRRNVGTVIIDTKDQNGQGNLLKYPTGLSLDQNNNLYIASVGDHCVQQFSPRQTN